MQYTNIGDLHLSKLTLGTAQLRLQYGIANRSGRPDDQKSREILKVATDYGINCFDTAPSYGDSEKVIGLYLASQPALSARVITVTKLSPLELKGKINYKNVFGAVKKQVARSTKRLQVKALPIYLLHSAVDMTACGGLIIESLRELIGEGLIGRVGVSVYTPEEVEQALGVDVLTAIQIPVNMFDHRLISSKLLGRLAEKQFIIFARSLLLQGLFLIDPDKLPRELELAERPLRLLRELSARHDRGVADMAIAFVRDLPGITSVVIGAETPEQVQADIELMGCPPLPPKLRDDIMSTFSDLPVKLINPSLWNIN